MTTLSRIKVPTTALFQRFKLGELLGKGSSGRVYVASDRDRGGEQVALKFVEMQSEDVEGETEDIEREFEIAQSVNSPYVAKLYDLYQVTPSKVTFYCDFVISMEYIRGPNLAEYAKDHPGEHLPQVAHDLINGLADMHTKFIHRDIKALNVVLDMPDGETLHRAVFVDFGLSCLKAACDPSGMGTFISPDHARNIRGTQTEYDLQSEDIYCVGAVLINAIDGKEDRSCLYSSTKTCLDGHSLATRSQEISLPQSLNSDDQKTLRELLIGTLQPTDDARMSIQEAMLLVKRWGKQTNKTKGPGSPKKTAPKPNSQKAASPKKPKTPARAGVKKKTPLRAGVKKKTPVRADVKKKTPQVAVTRIDKCSPRAVILAAGEGCLDSKEKRQNRERLIAIISTRCPEKLVVV